MKYRIVRQKQPKGRDLLMVERFTDTGWSYVADSTTFDPLELEGIVANIKATGQALPTMYEEFEA